MTKRREPLTYQLTLTEIAARIGWDRCGAICGVTDRAVRNWSDHDCEVEIRMIDAERLDRAYVDHGGDHYPFHRLFALRLDVASRAINGVNLGRSASKVAKETGEAVAALIDATASDDCPASFRDARKEIQEAISALTDSLAAIDAAQSKEAQR